MNTSWIEVKNYLKECIELQPVSQFEIIKQSGLSRDAYYKIFGEGRENSPMRKATVYGLAKALSLSVKYIDKLPQFSVIKRSVDFLPLDLARDALQQAVAIAGGVEELSNLTNMPTALFNKILSGTNEDTQKISKDFLVKVGSSLGYTPHYRSDGRAEYIAKQEIDDFGVGINQIESDSSLETFLDYHNYPTPSDLGLLQLFEETNIEKYDISDLECKELFLISIFRDSQTTIEHWISILHTLRSLSTL